MLLKEKVIVRNDTIIGTGVGDFNGISVPKEFIGRDSKELRFDSFEREFVDITKITKFHIDSNGLKHITDIGECQLISCLYSDKLINDSGTWRV